MRTKKKYNSMYAPKKVTDEEMEEYRRTRNLFDDPMLQMKEMEERAEKDPAVFQPLKKKDEDDD